MLPVVLDTEKVNVLMEDSKNGNEITIDLPRQKVVRNNREEYSFEVDIIVKNRLLTGLDNIGETLLKEHLIKRFEMMRSAYYPWLDGVTMPFVPVPLVTKSTTCTSQYKGQSSTARYANVNVDW